MAEKPDDECIVEDGKRSQCFPTSPSAKKPPSKKAKNVECYKDIYKSLESNFIYEEGHFTSVEEMKQIISNDTEREIRNVDLHRAVAELFGGRAHKNSRKMFGNQCDGKDTRKKVLTYSNVKQIARVKESVQTQSIYGTGIEQILRSHSVTNDALRKDLEENLRSTVTQMATENIALRTEIFNAKDQINQMQYALDKVELTNQEPSNIICSALTNTASLTADSSDVHLTKIQKQQLIVELKIVEGLHNLGLKNITETDDLNLIVNELFFEHVADKVEEKCPLLTEIVKLLCLGKQSRTNTGKKNNAFKFKSALHILNALGEIRSQRTTDEFGLMFGLLLVSYGCGRALLDAIHAFGLCKSYDFYRGYLTKRLEAYKDIVALRFPKTWPVILMFDNINIHKGKSRYVRIKQRMQPVMWNFTVRAVMKPNLSECELLWKDSETATKPQGNLDSLTADHLLLDAKENEDVKFLYDSAKDRMILDLLDFGINRTHVPANFGEENERDLTTFLNNNVVNNGKERKCNIVIPKVTEEYETSYEMKNIFILPISLADEAYTCGEALVYRQFSGDLNLNIQKRDEYISFNNRKKDYDLANARERYKMYKELDVHESELSNLEKTFESCEKVVVEDPCGPRYNDYITKYRQMVKQQERNMKKIVDFLEKGVADMSLEQSVSFVKCHSGMWSSLKDDYNRSALHIFVEKGNIKCVESLLICGACVNAGEGCGVTPLMIALMRKNVEMTKLLLKYEARVWGLFPGHLLTPMEICQKLQHDELMEVVRNVYTQEEMQSRAHAMEFLNTGEQVHELIQNDEAVKSSFSEQTGASLSYSDKSATTTARDKIITVGDVKTTVTTRGLKNRSPDEFGVFEETPGDFHALAYVMECLARVFGPAGFYYTARQILGRLKVTPNSFENMFKEENYERNFEALVDFYWGVGLAMVKKFEQSNFFPEIETIEKCESENGNANILVLARFKEWILDQSSKDKTFDFFSSFVSEYGLLLQIYQESIRYGNGKTREACWMEMLCLFPPLNKKNYRDEAFAHIVHFTSTWPLAVREMFRSNCSIAVKGRKHHNMAIDEYVESMLVKPMKEYAKKHTTLSMLQKINMNLELFKHVRRIYMKGFDLNKATARSKPDSLPDRLKICWFAIKEQWFDNLERKNIKKYGHNSKAVDVSPDSVGIVENKFLDVLSKGKKYIRENFKELLLRLFPNMDYVDE